MLFVQQLYPQLEQPLRDLVGKFFFMISKLGSQILKSLLAVLFFHEEIQNLVITETLLFGLKILPHGVNNMITNTKSDPKALNIFGFNSLFMAIKTKNYDLLHEILKEGVEINSTECKNMTPLIFALRLNDRKAFEILLNFGADINCSDLSKFTPLIYSTSLEDNWFLKKLIERNVDIDKADSSGAGALNYAVSNNNVNQVKIILNAGADFYSKDHLEISCFNNELANEKIKEILFQFKKEVAELRESLNYSLRFLPKGKCRQEFRNYHFLRACVNSHSSLITPNYLLRISQKNIYSPLEPHLLHGFESYYSTLISKIIVADLQSSDRHYQYEGLIGKITQYCDEPSLQALKCATSKGKKTLVFSKAKTMVDQNTSLPQLRSRKSSAH